MAQVIKLLGPQIPMTEADDQGQNAELATKVYVTHDPGGGQAHEIILRMKQVMFWELFIF